MFARISLKFLPRTGYLKRWFYKGQILKSTVEVRMPSLSPTMMQGNIVKWHKKEGDQISPGDMLCEIQTDKAVMAFEVEEEGTLAKILKGDNTNEVAVGTLIALIADGGTDWKSVKIPEDVVQEGSQKPQISESPVEAPRVERSHALGPAAKILLRQYNINASKVGATGPHGILLKSDVMKYIKEKDLKPVQVEQTSPKPPKASKMEAPKVAPSEPLPLGVSFSQMPVDHSRTNYKKLPIPHSYSSIDICMDAVERCCEEFKKDRLNVEYLDILIKAAAISLKKFPHLNAMWNNESIQVLKHTNISFSFDVDESHIFQEIEDAASLTVAQISSKIKEFKEKAISKELPDFGVSGSSLLISYLGNVDITSYHSVVIPPCVSCLSFVAPRSILNEDCTKILKTTVSMSFDSRVVDDVDATNFFRKHKTVAGEPITDD